MRASSGFMGLAPGRVTDGSSTVAGPKLSTSGPCVLVPGSSKLKSWEAARWRRTLETPSSETGRNWGVANAMALVTSTLGRSARISLHHRGRDAIEREGETGVFRTVIPSACVRLSWTAFPAQSQWLVRQGWRVRSEGQSSEERVAPS